jgi:hypothetical protein
MRRILVALHNALCTQRLLTKTGGRSGRCTRRPGLEATARDCINGVMDPGAPERAQAHLLLYLR